MYQIVTVGRRDSGAGNGAGVVSDGAGLVKVYISCEHPDALVCHDQLNQARRLHNTLLACFKEWWALRTDPGADTHITQSLGIQLDAGKFPDLEAWQKMISAAQDIVLNSKLRQQVRKKLNETLRSVFALWRGGESASLPGYKQGLCELTYIRQTLQGFQAAYIDDTQRKIIPTGWQHGIELPEFINPSQVKSLLIRPVANGYQAHILYRKPLITGRPRGKHKAAADLGVNGLIVCASTNPSARPKRVSGRPLKAINQYYNKTAGELRGQLSKETNPLTKQRLRLQLACLARQRENQLEHYINTVSNELAAWLVRTGVDEVAIGWSDGFKASPNMGKRNNQNFVNLPLAKLRDKLRSVLIEQGIAVVIQEESYTSKGSYIDRDRLPVYGSEGEIKPVFSGSRVARSWYKTKTGLRVHADLNGAFNILRKAFGQDLDLPVWLTPENLRLPGAGVSKASTGRIVMGGCATRASSPMTIVSNA